MIKRINFKTFIFSLALALLLYLPTVALAQGEGPLSIGEGRTQLNILSTKLCFPTGNAGDCITSWAGLGGDGSNDNIYLPNTTISNLGIIYKDNVPFIHNFNRGTVGSITTLGGNTFVGLNSGNLNMGSSATAADHASYNTALGANNLINISNGYNNTAIGVNTLQGLLNGHNNIAIGVEAFQSGTGGNYNIAIGYQSLSNYTSGKGAGSVAIGSQALYANRSGYNVAIGYRALRANTTGTNNIALGYDAGRYIANGSTNKTTGDDSIFIGQNTRANANAENNQIVIGANAIGAGTNTVVLGNDSIATTHLKGYVRVTTNATHNHDVINKASLESALSTIGGDNIYLPNTTTSNLGIIYKDNVPFIHNFNRGTVGSITTAGANTFVGLNAGNLTMGASANNASYASYNTAVGEEALKSLTNGYYNSALGYQALMSATASVGNIAIGYQAFRTGTTGDYNVAIGHQAFYSGSNKGTGSVAIGYQSLYSNTGSANSALGYYALRTNTSGRYNSALGHYALFANTTGTHNAALGSEALYANTTGTHNIALGYRAGRYIANGSTARQTGNDSIFIGQDTRANALAENNQIVIGANAIGAGANTVVLGADTITKTLLKGKVGVGITNRSEVLNQALNVKGFVRTDPVTAGQPTTGGYCIGADCISSWDDAGGGGGGSTNFGAPATPLGGTGLFLKRTVVNNANYTATANDYIIAFTNVSANRTLTLPTTLCNASAARAIIVVNESGTANVIIQSGTSGRKISGENQITIPRYGALPMYCNGTDWFIY